MRSKSVIINICYIIALTILAIMCGFVENISFFILGYISFGICLYSFFRLNNREKHVCFFCTMIIIMLLSIIHLYFDQKRKNTEFKEYGGWVTISIIDKKTSRRSDHCRIDFHYISRTDVKICGFENCPNEYTYNELRVGDTILIKHSNKDVGNYKIYNYFPTREEIERFKDGMPYEAIKNDKK